MSYRIIETKWQTGLKTYRLEYEADCAGDKRWLPITTDKWIDIEDARKEKDKLVALNTPAFVESVVE